mmetsp:Transcript_6055/g.23510  ORF Transcript_6055/g.23510 Transcript_6055/m.23510 type:complete len:98 (+) Transcript_6055:57-350(+)
MTLREVFGSGVQLCAVDASRSGNAARFVNHSCAPNLRVRIQRFGSMKPVPVLVAKRELRSGEEVTFDYFQDVTGDQATASATPCFCRAPNCRGFLPR